MKKRKGFTLIELLVTITIIGILAVGGIQVYTSQIKKAHDSRAVKDMQKLFNGIEQYILDKSEHIFLDDDMNTFNPPEHNDKNSETFRNSLREYIRDIDNIRHPKTGEMVCIRGTTFESTARCNYCYRGSLESNGGYKIFTTFESRSNVCKADEDCLTTRDGGIFNDTFEMGSNFELRGGVNKNSHRACLN